MRNSRKEKSLRTKRVAVSGMMVALGVIILYLGSLIEVLDISMAAIASLLCIIAVIEYGRIYAVMVFGATALISMLLLPSKFPPALYTLLIGYYPILKEIIERIGKKGFNKGASVIHWIIKIVFFNVALIAFALVAIYLLALPESAKWMQITMILLANATFVIYDVALTRLISTYIFRLRSRLRLPGGRM